MLQLISNLDLAELIGKRHGIGVDSARAQVDDGEGQPQQCRIPFLELTVLRPGGILFTGEILAAYMQAFLSKKGANEAGTEVHAHHRQSISKLTFVAECCVSEEASSIMFAYCRTDFA